MKSLARIALSTAGTAGIALVLLFPRPTHADVLEDWERQGEYDEDGIKFGNILIKGELVATANAPGGWALVRTFENKSDEAESCTVEERVLRTETMPEARVTPPPTAVILRTQTVKLAAHEKRSIGIFLPRALGEQITAGLQARSSIERQRERAVAAERWGDLELERTYMTFHVEYLKPLPPGATAAVAPNLGVTRPARMPSMGAMVAPGSMGAPGSDVGM